MRSAHLHEVALPSSVRPAPLLPTLLPVHPAARGAGVICAAKKGRRSTPDAKPKKRGPRPTTSADTLQTIDEATLQEFRQQAALEEATRVPEVVEPESEPQRFNFHRVLLNAASRGLTEVAEDTVEQMRSAELPPGPRAYHALVFSYVRAYLPYEALDTAARAADEDVRLLPETFVVLIYAMLNYARPPDVEKAKLVLESMEAQEGLPAEGGTSQGGAPGWNMLCTELFRKGMIGDAMTEVKKGNQKGYVSTPDLAKHVIEQLALAGLKEEAWQELASLVALGYRPGPDQYRHLVRAEAATGDWSGAHALLMDAMARPDWLPPNVEAFNSLLQGIVVSISPDKGRLPSSLGAAAQDRMAQGLDTDVSMMAESLEMEFVRLREEMLLYGFRPNAGTHAAMCEGYIRLGDLDSALGSMQSMRDAGGSTQLVSRRWISALLVSLAKSDRPMDLLNVLKSLVSANQRLPKSATRPIMDGTTMPGATIATVWLPAHYEYMRTHKDRGEGGAGGGGISSAVSGVRALMDQAMELRDFDGVKVSNLGNCVVEDDGSGIWIRPPRMTTKQMMVELEAAGMDVPLSGKRKDLSNAVKVHRESLPKTVKDIQSHLEQARKAEMEALERKTGLLLGQPVKPKRKGRVEVDQFRVLQMQDGKLRKILNVSQEVIKGRGRNYSRSVGGFSNYDEDLDLVMMGGRPMNPDAGDGPDEVDDIIREGVDEGVGEIIRSSDDIFGGTGEYTNVGDDTDRDTFDLTIDFMEARILNKSAGMSVAFEVLRSMEMLGATLSGPDLEALVTGAVTEENVDVALELSQRLPQLLSMGYEPAAVAMLYERLVRMCLSVLRGASADLVLERAEDAGLQVDPSLYVLLNKALAGRPRHREMAKAEVEGMADDPGVASILGDDAEAEEAVQAAGEDEEDDEEDEGEEQEELEQERQRGAQQQDLDLLEPLSDSHVFSFGADLLQQLDSEAGASDFVGLEARSRQNVGLLPPQEQLQALSAQRPALQQRLGQREEDEVVDTVAEEVQTLQARAEQEQRRDEEEAQQQEGLPWTQADEMELSALGGKDTVLDLTRALSSVLEERLGSEQAAEEVASRALSDEEGGGLEALMREDLLTEEELQFLLMRAMASGTGAVGDEEYNKVAEGELPEEDTRVMSQLVELLGQEAFSQVMNEAKHPADFARTEEDAERLHAMLDRFYSQVAAPEGGASEEEIGEDEDEVDAQQQKEVEAQQQKEVVPVTPEEAMQVARLMPNPTEGGLASFFDHLAQTQVARVRQTLNRQYTDPNWLAQKARQQHKRELVLAGIELGEKKEGEVFDDAELERIVSQQDEEELPPLAFLPAILRSDDAVMKQVELFAAEALAQSPGLFEPPAAQPELLPGSEQAADDEGEEGPVSDQGASQ